jgi:hypothetical protein
MTLLSVWAKMDCPDRGVIPIRAEGEVKRQFLPVSVGN